MVSIGKFAKTTACKNNFSNQAVNAIANNRNYCSADRRRNGRKGKNGAGGSLRMGAHMKKRILPVIIAILLILVIAGGALGKVLLDKYSYSKEEADWNEFYQVSESDRSAIILQDEMVEEQALIRDDVCYFDLATVHKYMNEVFYADMTEKLLLYANPTEVIRTTFGETSYTTTEGTQGCRICDQFRGRGYRICGGGLCEAVHKLFL